MMVANLGQHHRGSKLDGFKSYADAGSNTSETTRRRIYGKC